MGGVNTFALIVAGNTMKNTTRHIAVIVLGRLLEFDN